MGGAAKVAVALRARGVAVEDVTVRSWTLAGRKIPSGYWVHVDAIAAELGVSCSLPALAQSVAIPGNGPELPLSETPGSLEALAPSATKSGEIIGNVEADSPSPFPAGSASGPTSSLASPTSAAPATPTSPRHCSSGPTDAEAEAA